MNNSNPTTGDVAQKHSADLERIIALAVTCERLTAQNKRLREFAEKEIAWLLHIKPQLQLPESISFGFEQSIKSARAALAEEA